MHKHHHHEHHIPLLTGRDVLEQAREQVVWEGIIASLWYLDYAPESVALTLEKEIDITGAGTGMN